MSSRPNFPRGTRVALYLRRSTDTHQEESLDTQRRGATEYCVARGWVIVEEFVDDAVSRAEFKKRPGLIRMVNHAERKAFELVVLRDESRLGGDISRTGLVLQDLADAGVGVVYYVHDELVAMDTAIDKIMVSLRNFASELEREKISSRTYENLMQKAKAGRPAGGISYGYAIDEKRYVIKQPEAGIVRRIFAEYAAGAGLRTIARQLNEERVPSPRAGKRGTDSWAPSAIRAMLLNSRYVGEGKYNQTRKLYRGGTKVREARPASEHFTYACPAIVERSVWDAVASKFQSNVRFGTRPAVAGQTPRYLLTGISRCSHCGGPMTVGRRKYGKDNLSVYLCAWRKNRGTAVCSSMATERVDVLDARVVAKCVELFLTQDIIADVVRQAREIIAERQAAVPAESARLRAEADKLRREIERLTNVMASTDSPPGPLLQALAERDTRLRQTEIELAQVQGAAESRTDALHSIELAARRRVRDLEAQVHDVEKARPILKALFPERLLFEAAEGGGYKVRGQLAVSGLLRPDTAAAVCVASPAGFDTDGSALRAVEGLRAAFAA